MPRAREMKSLKGLCLDDVEKAVDDWINRLLVDIVSDSGSTVIDLLEKGEDDELYKRVSNFFDVLPSTLLLDIAKLIPFKFRQKERSKGNQLLWCYLEMLLSEGIAMVNQTAENVDGFLQVASKRCPLLKNLEIIRCPGHGCDIFPYNLEPYLQRFQQLRVLNIVDGDIGDSCLEILGAFCKDLRELDVSFCSKVTDVGLASLFVSVDHLGNKNESLGLCKSIVKLRTNGTQVTNSGIQVAIKNLPELEFCDMASIQILAEMHQRDFRSKEQMEIPKYSFVDLKLKKKYSSPYTWGSLKMVLSLCPFLFKVHITAIAGLKNADLLSLISVERLCELIIKGCEDSSKITFDDGVTPLLEAKGRKLKVLKLQDLGIPININTICELCPNLVVLALTGNRKYTPFTWNSSRPKRIKLAIPKLKNLVKLSLGSCCASCRGPDSCIPSENLAFLLLSPLLVEIDIRNCDTLTDDVLLTAAQSNPFLLLEELVLGGCDSITKKGVNVFMQENGIKRVVLIECSKLTLDNILTWKNKAVQNHWNLMFGCILFQELPTAEND